MAATDTIGEVVTLVERLLAVGAAYRVDDPEYPDIYRVGATDWFGYESGLDRAQMTELFAERGGDPDRAGKADELDALWRAARDGEPSWDYPFGPGRPGWHVECSAIALNRLGVGFDIQGGGVDLVFPHHEFSAAHAEAATSARRFARHYVHAGMIGWDGHKMSKSRGNLVLVSRLRARCRPRCDPAGPVRRTLPRRPVLDRRGAGRGDRAPGPLACGGRAAGRSRHHRSDHPAAWLSRRRPRHTQGAGRRRRLGHRRTGIRRTRHRSPGSFAAAVDALLGVAL